MPFFVYPIPLPVHMSFAGITQTVMSSHMTFSGFCNVQSKDYARAGFANFVDSKTLVCLGKSPGYRVSGTRSFLWLESKVSSR